VTKVEIFACAILWFAATYLFAALVWIFETDTAFELMSGMFMLCSFGGIPAYVIWRISEEGFLD